MIVIAHRGASAIAPEHTRAAIVASARSGAQMLELDVRQTRDRRLIVFHDDRLDRTTTGAGQVNRMRYTDLARLDAGSWFHPRFAGERILLLSQVFSLIPRRMAVNVELKRTARPRTLVAGVIRCVRLARRTRRVLISSLDASLVRPFRTLGWRCALICRSEPDRSLRRAIRLGCASWHPHHTLVSQRRVALAHAARLQVYTWTVDEPALARRLSRLGVDGIFTNSPARMVRALR